MTMHKITAKLRRQNKDQYRLLGICIFLSVLLVASFALMFFSPSIQEFLPPGGDTRKLMWLMLGVVAIGCLLFTLYGSGLFFRGKSREFGVMLALGAQKKELARQLSAELAAVVGKYILAGMLLAAPVSFLIWKLFRVMVIDTKQMQYSIGMTGILAGLLFASALCLCILILGIRFIRRANIMDILNAARKTEMVREIRPWTGKLGAFLVIMGLFLAMAVPQISARLFKQGMPGIWNVTYLLCVAGLYLLMLSSVARARKGKHPEKYYKNIISTNLMRFTARQTTRNMCVIALLVFVVVVSAFWGVMYYYSATEGGREAPYDYSMHYPAKERQISREETMRLAEAHGVNITSYEELESLQLLIRYTGRDMDDNRRYFDVEYEKPASFISASDFARISGHPVLLAEGEYKTVTTTGYSETIWVSADCLNAIEHPLTKESISPVFGGTVEFDNLAIGSDPFAFVLSDEDYQRFSDGLTEEQKEKHAFFNVEHVMETYDFADEWKKAYMNRATDLSDYYEPFSKVLMQAGAMELVAVFVLLSLYIAVISLAAAGIMSYVRSVTIAMDNRQLFEDLKKLGADNAYEESVMKVQLRKIFVYPVAAGCMVTGIFSLFLTWFNDMNLQIFEVKMLLMELFLMALIAGILYGVYRLAYRRTKQIAGIAPRTM